MSGVLQPWRIEAPGVTLRRCSSRHSAQCVAGYHLKDPLAAIAIVSDDTGERWERLVSGDWVCTRSRADVFHGVLYSDQEATETAIKRSLRSLAASRSNPRGWNSRKRMAKARSEASP